MVMNSFWYLTPSISTGVHHEGAGCDLGHSLEFYSQLKLAYKIRNNSTVGLGVDHISNARIGDINPGANMVSIHYKGEF